MKNLLLTVFAGAAFLLASCNTIDPAVVDSVQASISKLQEGQPGLAAAARNMSNLREQMSQAPDGLKANPQFGYPDLMMRVDAFSQRYALFQQTQDSMQAKLESLLADYTDGKIKKEAVLTEHEAVKASIEGFQTSLDRMGPMFDQMSAEFAKMSATWKSLPEEERAALSATQPADALNAIQPSSPAPRNPGSGSLTPGSLQGPVNNPSTVRPETSNSLVKPGRKQ